MLHQPVGCSVKAAPTRPSERTSTQSILLQVSHSLLHSDPIQMGIKTIFMGKKKLTERKESSKRFATKIADITAFLFSGITLPI